MQLKEVAPGKNISVNSIILGVDRFGLYTGFKAIHRITSVHSAQAGEEEYKNI